MAERINEFERSFTQMKTMMSQVLCDVGVKETDQELTESQVEKKRSKRSHKKHRRARSTSASSVTSASEEDEGKTKEYSQKRFLAKEVKAKPVEDILLVGIKTIEKIVAEKSDPLPVIRHVKFLAEKASKCMLEAVAFVKYDKPLEIV